MNPKHIFTAANVLSAIYRIAYTGVLLYSLFSKKRDSDSYGDFRR
jgi:hypothetical protein